MYEKMSFQIALSSKRFPTVITSVRSDSAMDEEMTFQMVVFSKCLPTDVTRVWLIASAPPTVNYHVAPFRRRLFISVTFVILLWTSVHAFFLALSPGMVAGTTLLELHEIWKGG